MEDVLTNYMKIRSPKAVPTEQFVFFNDEDALATEAAFARALAIQRASGGEISVFRMPRTHALPVGVSVIGCRLP